MHVCPECGEGFPAAGFCPRDGIPLADNAGDPLLGITVGSYRIARLLVEGGMGKVYKGVHPGIGSRVAVKVLSYECAQRHDLVERFFSEARAVNLIRHESIVNVLDLATLPDGRPYIIMEYLDGAPLASIVEHAVTTRTPLPLGGLARLAVEVLDALGAAHAKGIVHRDLKPDNIFVTPSGRPKVLDFGIAKLNDAGIGSATRTGSLLGTPHYMSPEQAAGKPADHRADIYAIGVILFECVTGQRPFVAESLFDLLRMHIEVPPPSPRALRPDLSPDVESVILTALAKSPDQRFASAQAMSVALQHATSQLAPEQWTPITGSGTHRAVPSGGWQPTPPASWGGAPRGPRESVQPPHIGQLSTVSASAGQLQKADTRPIAATPASKRAVWIALGAAVVAGGVVAAVVVAGGGDGGTSPTKPAEIVASESPTPPLPPPTTDDDEEPTPTESLDIDVADTAKHIEKKGKRIEKKLEQIEKKLEQLEKPDPPPPAGDPIASTPPARGTIWDGDFELRPFKANPKRVDVSAFIRFAVREAKRADPGAVLIRIDAPNVDADGFADLTLPTLASDHGSIDLRFVSMERGKRDPSTPIGVPHRDKRSCEFRIEIEPDGADIRTISPAITEAASCSKQRPIPAPRCTAAQLWQKAIAKGAPPKGAVAELSFRANIVGGKIDWWFDIKDVFDARFPDNC
jgi:serine/threonine-protein kinase